MVDLGTGDGRCVLARAAANPTALVVGIDASQERLRSGAAQAYRRALRNAVFVVAAAEDLPSDLAGAVDELTIHFPWGSLLRGLLLAEPRVMEGLARLLRPGACVSALVSVVARDGLTDLPQLDDRLGAQLARTYAEFGLRLVRWSPASPTAIAETHSTWSKRLAAGRKRVVWQLKLRRTPERPLGS